MRAQIFRTLQYLAYELFRFLSPGRVERRQAALSGDLPTKELAMFSVCVTVLKKDRGVTPSRRGRRPS